MQCHLVPMAACLPDPCNLPSSWTASPTHSHTHPPAHVLPLPLCCPCPSAVAAVARGRCPHVRRLLVQPLLRPEADVWGGGNGGLPLRRVLPRGPPQGAALLPLLLPVAAGVRAAVLPAAASGGVM